MISIGLVSHKNGDCFYAELHRRTYLQSCSDWVLENVLPLLEGDVHVMPFDRLRKNLFDWIGNQEASKIVTDFPKYDIAFLQAILDPWPSHLDASPVHFSLSDVSQSHPDEMQTFCDTYYRQDRPQHHALHDAKALRQIWLLTSKKHASKK